MNREEVQAIARQIARTGKHAITFFTMAGMDGTRTCMLPGVGRVTAAEYDSILLACRGQRDEVESPADRARGRARQAADRHGH